jgi:hypothetical protein
VEDNQQEIQERLSHLENIRLLLEEARGHARDIGSPEGGQIDTQIATMLSEINK